MSGHIDDRSVHRDSLAPYEFLQANPPPTALSGNYRRLFVAMIGTAVHGALQGNQIDHEWLFCGTGPLKFADLCEALELCPESIRGAVASGDIDLDAIRKSSYNNVGKSHEGMSVHRPVEGRVAVYSPRAIL